MADAVVVGLFDPVAVVAHAFDDTGVGPVPARAVQVACGGDVAADGGQQVL